MNEKLCMVARCNASMDNYVLMSERPIPETEAIKMGRDLALADDFNYVLLELSTLFKREYCLVEQELSLSQIQKERSKLETEK